MKASNVKVGKIYRMTDACHPDYAGLIIQVVKITGKEKLINGIILQSNTKDKYSMVRAGNNIMLMPISSKYMSALSPSESSPFQLGIF